MYAVVRSMPGKCPFSVIRIIMARRTFEEEKYFINQIDSTLSEIEEGFVPGMKVIESIEMIEMIETEREKKG